MNRLSRLKKATITHVLPHVSYQLELGNSPVMSQLGVIAGQACLFPFSKSSSVLSVVPCPKFVITCMLSVFVVIQRTVS